MSLNIKNSKKTILLIGPQQGLPDYIVTQILPAGKDLFWISLQDKGFCLYNNKDKKITIPSFSKNWKYGQVNSILQDENNIWVATQEWGVIIFTIKSEKIVKTNIKSNNISRFLIPGNIDIFLI